MKKREVENSLERQILIGMITSNEYLARVAPIYRPEYHEGSMARTVAGWCINFFKDYGKAPHSSIESIFESHVANSTMSEDTLAAVDTFLRSLSSEYEQSEKFNLEYLFDKTVSYYRGQSLRHVATNLDALLSQNKIEEAEREILNYRTLAATFTNDQSNNPIYDPEIIQASFEQDSEPLFKYGGAFGRMINPDLCRDSFIGIMAPEKRGKTWILTDIVLTAASQRCNVAFFQAGDMTDHQQIRRIHIRLAGRSHKERYCGTVYVPVHDCRRNQEGLCNNHHRRNISEGPGYDPLTSDLTVEEMVNELNGYIPCDWCRRRSPKSYQPSLWWIEKKITKPLDWREAYKQGLRFKRLMGGRKIKLSSHPNRTLNVGKIKTLLDLWEHMEGFIPDVIVIDYADIMAPESGRLGHAEFRHQQNETWQALRALSQERHCLVITATQADAASYGQESLSLKNFSEDKRKYAHVTSMIALNQTQREKQLGVMRVSQLVVRDDEFDLSRQVYLLQCLQIGRPILGSFEKINNKKDID